MSDEARGDDRLSGIVAVFIAFTTLIAALAGFLQADSAHQAGARRDAAEQLSLQALASSHSAQQRAQVELETFALWAEQRTRAGNALVGSLYAASDPTRANRLTLEMERWEVLAAATLALSDINPEGEFGPEQDRTFPTRYFSAATEESLRLNALQDAANEEASALDRQAASYTAILAMLAVSLYLFGLTLAVRGQWRRFGFLGVGLGLLTVGMVWLVQSTLTPGLVMNDEAAAAYARGRVALINATDRAGYEQAIAHYDAAIELRPSFARAYSDRSDAIFLSESPQRTGFISIVPPEALERARADLEAARSLGLESAATYGSLGFYGFSQGVQEGDIALLNESADFTRRAIALDPLQPIYRYNLAVTLVAADRPDEARAAYQEAVARTLYLDLANTRTRGEPFVQEQWLAGALTDLEIVRRYRPDLADSIRGFKEQIVGRVASQSVDAPTGSPAVFSDIQLDIFPAEVQWQGTVEGYDAARDTISAQWYHQDPQALGWAVIPEVSQPETPSIGSDGRLFQLAAYTSSVFPPACLPSGSYRVELYVNGRLAAEGSADVDFGQYDAFFSRELTVALCRPPDWVRRPDRLPGLIDGFQSPDLERGVYAARLPLPGTIRSLPDVAASIEDITIESFIDLFPARPTYWVEAGTSSDYFMGLSDTAWRWYDYGTGYVRIAAGLTSDGAAVLGMVYGPYEWFDTDEPYRILNSMISVQ